MAYEDISSSFVYKTLITWQLWDKIAENNAFDHIESGVVMTFFQASAPTGWTKVTTQNDKYLRVVSGSGGGNGGTDDVSSPPSHTHAISAHAHTMFAGSVFSGATSVGSTTTNTDGSGTTGAESIVTPKYVDMIIASKD